MEHLSCFDLESIEVLYLQEESDENEENYVDLETVSSAQQRHKGAVGGMMGGGDITGEKLQFCWFRASFLKLKLTCT